MKKPKNQENVLGLQDALYILASFGLSISSYIILMIYGIS
jgi:hypothetical protein